MADLPIFVQGLSRALARHRKSRQAKLTRGKGEAFRVYNRWGALLFERTNFQPNDESLGWGGRAGGQPAPPGTYVYQLIARRLDGRAVRLEGEVSLMR